MGYGFSCWGGTNTDCGFWDRLIMELVVMQWKFPFFHLLNSSGVMALMLYHHTMSLAQFCSTTRTGKVPLGGRARTQARVRFSDEGA